MQLFWYDIYFSVFFSFSSSDMTRSVAPKMDDTRYLLPSEIARLVYGYLKQMHCHEVAEKFLNTSPLLKECLEMRNKNCTFMTKAHGMTLEEICNQCLTMNGMLLEAVNTRQCNSKKFHDAVEALKFVINPTITHADPDLVNDNPNNIERDVSVDTHSNFHSSPGAAEPSCTINQSELTACADSLSKESVTNDESASIFDTSHDSKNDPRQPRTLDANAVLNKCGKVKVLRPRNSVPVIGKTMAKSAPLVESDPPSEAESVGVEPDVPSPSGRTDDDDFVAGGNAAANECSFLESASKSMSAENVLTMQLRSQTARLAEESPSVGGRSRRCRKKSNGSWNGDTLSASGKPSATKLVPEIEVDPALIQQTLIKNPKLHECIAQNINKAISESPQKKVIIDHTDELNSTVKKVTDETMNDPLCKEIIDELLGCLTTVNLGLHNETEDTDNSNLGFPSKFYENVETNDLNMLTNEPANEAGLTGTEANQNYQSIEDFVSSNPEKPSSEIVLVNMPENEKTVHQQHEYGGDAVSGRSLNLNSDIRSYIMNTSDIKETHDSVETINGTEINVLEAPPTSMIQIRDIGLAAQFCIPPEAVFVGSVAGNAMNAKKRTSRYQPCSFPGSRVTRRLTPIAPKPSAETAEVQPVTNTTKNQQSKTRPAKKMKK